MSITYVIRLDERRAKQDKTFPLKLWVTKDRKSMAYSTKYSLSKQYYQKLSSPNIREDLREIRDNLKALTRSLDDYLKEVGLFTFDMFNIVFVQRCPYLKARNRGKEVMVEVDKKFDLSIYEKKFRILKETGATIDSLLGGYSSYIRSLLRIKSIRTADVYQTSYYSLFAFAGNVKLRSITKQFLKEYDVWMRDQGNKKTTIGIYLRTLRKIFNNAIEDEVLSKKEYPFGRNKYIIPSGSNTKKAIDSSLLPGIYYYQPNHKTEWFARDTWLFLYFGNGMNPKDMALLKYKNIQADYIIFERSKVENTAREGSKQINVFLSEDLSAIIQRWGNKKIDDETYVFPILNNQMNPLEQMFAIQNFVRRTNDWMKEIFKALGYDARSSTIIARHSFSTHMLYAGASKELIQESLGHHNIKTTENYLASFEKKVVKEFSNKLTAFKHSPNNSNNIER